MLELLGICFVTFPLADRPGAEVAINLTENFAGMTYDPSMPDRCEIHANGMTFVVGWSCERTVERFTAHCK